MKNLMRIGIVVLAAMTAVGCCGNRYDAPFFTTRGIVLSWDDVKAPDRLDWVAMADSAHVNTLSIYCSEATKQTPEYRDFIDRCAEKGIDVVCAIGDLAKSLAEGASANPQTETHWFETKADFLSAMNEIIRDGDNVLVKASHGMWFPELVEELQKF